MAAKSHVARRTNIACAELTQYPTPHLAQNRSQPAADPYVAGRLVRVRKQLDRLDRLMADETDPQRLDRLASAQYRLSEQERILAGRPLPGSHRPIKEPVRRPAYHEEGPLGLDLPDAPPS